MSRENVSLADFSTCEISDALIKLSVPHGGHIPDIHIASPTSSNHCGIKICGPAYTVKMALASSTDAPSLSEHFVDTAPAGAIIVIDAPEDAKNAVWGGLMTAGAQARGVSGVVISGRCRDSGEHRLLGFPVFCRGHSTLGQSPFTRPSAVNIPLTIKPPGQGTAFPMVTVNPGDWIIADEDGVVCVAKDLKQQVIAMATIGREIDRWCMEDIKAGKGVQASFNLYRGK